MEKFCNYLLLTCVVLGFSVLTYAQNSVQPDTKLLVKYSETEIENIRTNDSFQIEWENWLLDNSYTILEIEDRKTENLPYLQEFDISTKTIGNDVDFFNPESFNIHEVFYERDYQKPSLYKIGDTGFVISFHSYRTLTKEYNLLRDEKK